MKRSKVFFAYLRNTVLLIMIAAAMAAFYKNSVATTERKLMLEQIKTLAERLDTVTQEITNQKEANDPAVEYLKNTSKKLSDLREKEESNPK